MARFCERAAEYRATVRRVGADELDAADRGRLRASAASGASRCSPGAGAPELAGVELVVDEPPLALRGARRASTAC